MNITTKLLALGFFVITLFCSNYILAMDHFEMGLDESVITGASYCIGNDIDQDSIAFCQLPRVHKYVTFYTFDGEEIETLEQQFNAPLLASRIDRQAPKPQPVKCEIRPWPTDGTSKGPRMLLCFFDKHGNLIKSCRYTKSPNSIYLNFENSGPGWPFRADDRPTEKGGFPLDLSKIDVNAVTDLS